MAELSLRPGTSGTLNRTWPDHPCVTVMWSHKIITTRLKALERLLVFIVPSLQLAFLASLDTPATGENAMPRIGHA